MSLDVISRAVKQYVELSPGENWLKMWGQITDGSTNPLWSKMLPDDIYREYVSRVVGDTRMLLDSIDDTYFVKEFLIYHRTTYYLLLHIVVFTSV